MIEKLSPGTIFDERYEIVSLLGQGGLGSVYKARQISGLERIVAIKILHKEALDDEDGLERFRREGLALAKLKHPGIPIMYHFGFWLEQIPYLAMEYIDGKSLRKELQELNSLPADRVIAIGKEISQSMFFAHKAGILHRDLKPENIMLLEDGHVKVCDFGLVKFVGKNNSQYATLTETGFLIGTVSYLSPEQCQGKAPDERSDIYALGCILYEMLSGQRPFDADTSVAVIYKHINEKAAPLDTAKLPAGLSQVVAKAMSKDPGKRQQSMAEFGKELDLVSSNNWIGPPEDHAAQTPNPRAYRFAIFTAAVVVLMLLGLGLSQRIKPRPSTALPKESDKSSIVDTWIERSKMRAQDPEVLYKLISSPAVLSEPMAAQRLLLNNQTRNSFLEQVYNYAFLLLVNIDSSTALSGEQQRLVSILTRYLSSHAKPIDEKQRKLEEELLIMLQAISAYINLADGDSKGAKAKALFVLRQCSKEKELREIWMFPFYRCLRLLNDRQGLPAETPAFAEALIAASKKYKHNQIRNDTETMLATFLIKSQSSSLAVSHLKNALELSLSTPGTEKQRLGQLTLLLHAYFQLNDLKSASELIASSGKYLSKEDAGDLLKSFIDALFKRTESGKLSKEEMTYLLKSMAATNPLLYKMLLLGLWQRKQSVQEGKLHKIGRTKDLELLANALDKIADNNSTPAILTSLDELAFRVGLISYLEENGQLSKAQKLVAHTEFSQRLFQDLKAATLAERLNSLSSNGRYSRRLICDLAEKIRKQKNLKGAEQLEFLLLLKALDKECFQSDSKLTDTILCRLNSILDTGLPNLNEAQLPDWITNCSPLIDRELTQNHSHQLAIKYMKSYAIPRFSKKKLFRDLTETKIKLATNLFALQRFNEAEKLLNETLDEAKGEKKLKDFLPIIVKDLCCLKARAGDFAGFHRLLDSEYSKLDPSPEIVELNTVWRAYVYSQGKESGKAEAILRNLCAGKTSAKQFVPTPAYIHEAFIYSQLNDTKELSALCKKVLSSRAEGQLYSFPALIAALHGEKSLSKDLLRQALKVNEMFSKEIASMVAVLNSSDSPDLTFKDPTKLNSLVKACEELPTEHPDWRDFVILELAGVLERYKYQKEVQELLGQVSIKKNPCAYGCYPHPYSIPVLAMYWRLEHATAKPAN